MMGGIKTTVGRKEGEGGGLVRRDLGNNKMYSRISLTFRDFSLADMLKQRAGERLPFKGTFIEKDVQVGSFL